MTWMIWGSRLRKPPILLLLNPPNHSLGLESKDDPPNKVIRSSSDMANHLETEGVFM